MNPKPDKRIIREVYHTTITSSEGSICLTFQGETKTGTPITATVEMKWFLWPYVIRDALKAWITTKQSRILEIQRIDEAFPKQP